MSEVTAEQIRALTRAEVWKLANQLGDPRNGLEPVARRRIHDFLLLRAAKGSSVPLTRQLREELLDLIFIAQMRHVAASPPRPADE